MSSQTSERHILYNNGPVVSFDMLNPKINSDELREIIETKLSDVNDGEVQTRKIWRRMLHRNEKKSDLSSRFLANIINQLGIAEHHTLDYDDWLQKRLIRQIAYRSLSETLDGYTFNLNYSNLRIRLPTTETGEALYPSVARILGLTYSVTVFVDATLTMSWEDNVIEITKAEHIMMAKIPVMMGSSYDRTEIAVRKKIEEAKTNELGSSEGAQYSYIDRYIYGELVQDTLSSMGESPLDIPGYFIVEGKSKIIKLVDGMRNNVFFIDTSSIYLDGIAAVINCTTALGTSPVRVYSKHKGLLVVYLRLSDSERSTNIFNVARALMYNMKHTIEVYDKEEDRNKEVEGYMNTHDMDQWFVNKIYKYCGTNTKIKRHAQNLLKLSNKYVEDLNEFESMEEIMLDFGIKMDKKRKKKLPVFDIDFSIKENVADFILDRLDESVYPQISYLDVDELSNDLTRLETFAYHVYLYIAASAGEIDPTDKNVWSYKRVDTSGRLLELLYGRSLNKTYKRTIIDFRAIILDYSYWFYDGIVDKKELIDSKVKTLSEMIEKIVSVLRSKYPLLTSSISTTSWGIHQKKFDKTAGIDNTSRVYRISQMNMMSSEVSKHDTNIDLRAGHKSGVYIYDVFSLRESGNIGLEKEKSLVCAISIRMDQERLMHKILKYCTRTGVPKTKKKLTGICMVSGIYIGECNLEEVESYVRRYKRSWKYRHITIMSGEQSVFVETDAGRTLFPAVIVKDGKIPIKEEHLSLTLRELIEQGLIEYLDPADTYIIAESWDIVTDIHTHAVLHPAQGRSFGVLKQAFSDKSDPVRVSYGSHMMRGTDETGQAGPSIQRDPRIIELVFGDHALVSSVLIDFMNRMTQDGTVLYIQVDERGADNAEDALMMSEQSVQLGAFMIKQIDTVKLTLPLTSKEGTYNFGIPPYVERSRSTAHLTEQGIPKINSVISKGDILVGRYLIEEGRIIDKSSISKNKKQRGIVYSVSVSIVSSKSMIVTIQFVRVRLTEQGRKFSHSFGQKGVAGKIEKSWNLSYVEITGRLPDAAWHAFGHRRSTLSLIIEQWLASSTYDRHMVNVDGTPYTKFDLEDDMYRMNVLTGIESDGRLYVIDQRTGRRKKNPIFHSYPSIRSSAKQDPSLKYQASSGINNISTLTRTPTKHEEGHMKSGKMSTSISAYHSPALLNSVFIDGATFDLYFCASCGMRNHTQDMSCFMCGQPSVKRGYITGPMSYGNMLLASKGYILIYREN